MNANLSFENQASMGLIIGGYIFALLGGAIGMLIGLYLISSKKTFGNEKAYRFNNKSRNHGWIIFVLGGFATGLHLVL